MDLLATTALRLRLAELQAQLNEIEHQMTETNPHSDQALLDEAWSTTVEEMEELQEILAMDEINAIEDTRGCHQCSGCANCDESTWGYDPNGEI